jgi:hypothetical protein
VTDQPNLLFFHVDNLGFGELSCYSGGPFRGASTSRIDAFAESGMRLTTTARNRSARRPGPPCSPAAMRSAPAPTACPSEQPVDGDS